MSDENQQSGLVPARQAASKPPVAIGARGLTPQTLDDLFRVSTAISKSGLAPKGIETPEAIFAALEMGMEVGLPLMASLQNIAVVNGRPTLWGDAQLAVVRATGELEEFSEWYEVAGTRSPRNPSTFGDDVAAVVRVKRRGQEAAETAFSVADAKRAGLWGKAGPWSQYPARMLRYRARSFGLRDQFGDALRGLLSTEEAQDVITVEATAPAKTVGKPIFATPSKTAPKPEPAPDDEDLGPVATVTAAPQTNPTPAAVVDPTPSPALTPAPSVSEQLAEAVLTVATFDDFRAWAVENKYDGADGWASFDEVPAKVAERLVKARTGFLNALKAHVGGAK